MTAPLRHVAAAVLAVLAALALTACGAADGTDGSGSDPTRVVTIVGQDWNGWDPDHELTPETTILPVEVGASVTVDGLGEQVTFEVVGIDDAEVTVSSDRELAPEGEGGGIDLNDLVDEATVTAGEETRLATPTMDAGYSYTLTLDPA